MNNITIATLVTELCALVAAIVPVIAWVKKLADGQKCQLRSEMLRIYYRHCENETLRQYEYENFVYLYEAYKALKGNSFIDKIYNEVQKWDIVP